jgi:hypothetical protein
MGDMGELFNLLRSQKKERAHYLGTRYTHELCAAGAQFKTDGVYRLGDFDCYPGRGYARNYRTNKKTCIEYVIKYKGDASKFPAPKGK